LYVIGKLYLMIRNNLQSAYRSSIAASLLHGIIHGYHNTDTSCSLVVYAGDSGGCSKP
jgi:hypothetical protein